MITRIDRARASFLVAGAVFIAWAHVGEAHASPVVPGALVSEGPRCRALLTKVSYDDPGADDAELLELYVDRSPGGTGADGGRPDGSVPALTLGDCHLGALVLVDGGGGACDAYRTIPLALVPVPADGYVTLCSNSSTLAAGSCDVTMAGRSRLDNGWLQNGPSDGLRFLDERGATALEVSYEGQPGCFGAQARFLADETGQLASAAEPTDDVNALCDGAFTLVSPADAPLRAPARCPAPLVTPDPATGGSGGSSHGPPGSSQDGGAEGLPLPGGGGGRGGGMNASSGAGGTSWVSERAPASPPGVRPGYGAIDVDSGLVPFVRAAGPPPSPPGCALVRERIAGRGGADGGGEAGGGFRTASGLVLALAVGLRRRTRRSGCPRLP